MWLRRYWLPLPIIFVFAGILAGSTPLIGLGAFLLLTGAVATYWSRHAFDRVSYTRIIPENRAFAGETVSLTLRLVNDKLLPLSLIEVRDIVPEGVFMDEAHVSPASSPHYVQLTRATHLSAYERISWPLRFQAGGRGYYRLGPVRLTSGDGFGLFPAERDEENFASVLIYPAIYTLPELGLPAERPFGERKGKERIFEDPSRIAGARDYRPGDPMRRIDWKATARRQSLQSKVYEPSSSLHMLIAVNVHTLAHSWEGFVPETLERLLSVAGSVARYGFEAGYAIGLAANGSYPTSDRPMRVPVGRRPEQLVRVLEALAVIGPLTLTALETVLDREAQSFPFGATLVCVTSRMDDPMAAALLRIAGAGHSVTVLSIADGPFETDLGSRIRVFNLLNAMRSLELRNEPLGAAT